jgi:hypothetical protein
MSKVQGLIFFSISNATSLLACFSTIFSKIFADLLKIETYDSKMLAPKHGFSSFLWYFQTSPCDDINPSDSVCIISLIRLYVSPLQWAFGELSKICASSGLSVITNSLGPSQNWNGDGYLLTRFLSIFTISEKP